MTYTDQFLAGLVEFLGWAKWLVAAALILTTADLWFGIKASQFRKETIKRSRAIRRTFDKICSYVLWITVAYTFGEAFGQPFGIDVLPFIVLIVIYAVELESIYSNYFASKGEKKTVKILKWFGKKTDIIEIEEDKDNG